MTQSVVEEFRRLRLGGAGVQGQTGLHGMFEASLGCTARARLRIVGKSWRNHAIAFCVTSYVFFYFLIRKHMHAYNVIKFTPSHLF